MFAIHDKSIKLIALALTFFLFGLLFFILDKWREPAAKQPEFKAVARQNVSSGNLFANYPPPENFRHFTYSASESEANDFLSFNGECRDKYIAVLAFDAAVDYRNDPARAVFNRAVDCSLDKKFSYKIFFNEFGALRPGEYYAFVADQGERGLWYNAR